MKNVTTQLATLMKQSEWLNDFAFTVDVLDRINEPDLKLHVHCTVQGKGVFAYELFA